MANRKRVVIYIEGEGGGNRARARQALDGEFRKAWQSFLSPLREHAMSEGVDGGFSVVACGSGGSALDQFNNPGPNAEALRVLLIDSERAVKKHDRPWAAICKPKPDSATDDHLFLMVQCLEAWLVADVDAIRQHYDSKGKPCFDARNIPGWPNPETVHRHTVQKALETATARCNAPYRHADGNVIIGKLRLEGLAAHKKMQSPRRLLEGLKQTISAYAQA